MRDVRHSIAILHNPRTGGTALRNSMVMNLRQEEVLDQSTSQALDVFLPGTVESIYRLVFFHMHSAVLDALMDTHVVGTTIRDPISRLI